MNSKKIATVGALAVVGVGLIVYGIYVYLYVPPQVSPGGVDTPADVDNQAAWLAGVIVVIGFGVGMILVAVRTYRKARLLNEKAR